MLRVLNKSAFKLARQPKSWYVPTVPLQFSLAREYMETKKCLASNQKKPKDHGLLPAVTPKPQPSRIRGFVVDLGRRILIFNEILLISRERGTKCEFPGARTYLDSLAAAFVKSKFPLCEPTEKAPRGPWAVAGVTAGSGPAALGLLGSQCPENHAQIVVMATQIDHQPRRPRCPLPAPHAPGGSQVCCR